MDKRVELIISLLGYDASMRSLNDFKRAAEQLNGYKIQPQIELRHIERQITDVRQKLQALRSQKAEIKIEKGDLTEVNAKIKETLEQLSGLRNRRDALKLELGDLNLALQYVGQLEKELGNVENAATRAGKAFSAIGSGMVSVGNALQKIGGVFTNNSIIDTLERYATIMATRMFTQNWGKAFERYDILSTYADYLGMVGISAEEASESLGKLNAGIQGIPVGLSDVAYQTRMYQMYIDDLDRATKLAVGLERALVAGGANEQMRNTARYEIDRLLSAGELSTSRQYRALLQGLGVSSRFLREEMGYGEMSNAEFINALFKKNITGDELIRGLERLADSDKLNAAIEVYRTTIESGLSNIRFALTRGKANILEALNESLEVGTGRNISGWLYQIRDGLNEVYASLSSWVRANPDRIKGVVDSVIRIFERLRDIDWAKIIEGIVGGVERVIDIMVSLSNVVPKGWLEDFIVFSTVWAKPIANAFVLIGGAVNTLGVALSFIGGGKLASAFAPILTFATSHPAIAAAAAAVAALGLSIASLESSLAGDELTLNLNMEDVRNQIKDVDALKKELDEVLKPKWTNPGKWGEDLEAAAKSLEPFIAELRANVKDAEEEKQRLERLWSTQTVTERMLDPNYFGDVRRYQGLQPYIDATKEELAALEAYYDQIDAMRKKISDRGASDENLPVRNYDHGYEDIDAAIEAAEVAASKLEELQKEHEKIRESYQKILDDTFSGFGKYEPPKKTSAKALEENLNAHIKAFTKYRDNLQLIRDYVVGNNMEGLAAYVDELQGEGDTASIDAIAKALADGDFKRLQRIDQKYNEFLSEKKLESEKETILNDLRNLGLQGVVDRVKNGELSYGGNVEEVLLEALKSELEQLDRERIKRELEEFIKPGGEEDASFLDIDSFLGLKPVDEGEFEKKKAEVVGQYQELIAAINQAVQESESSEDTSASQWLTDMQTLIAQVKDEDLPPLLEALSTGASTSAETANTATATVKKNFEEAIESMIRALNKLVPVATNVASHLVTQFARVKGAIQEAVNKVDELRSQLEAIDGKHYTVYVDVVTTGEIPGGGHDAGQAGGATGGLIDGPGPAKYYAKGGWVFMKPKGTDTVPAMLTPGEYVLRKDAVDKLGVPFLRRLNRLDIAGAFDALMSRVYKPNLAAMAAYSTTYNRYDNRNYTVKQDIHTNNPDYSYRVASRFAHAL